MLDKLSITTIDDGLVVARINEAIAAAVANITDFEFPEQGKRTVSCKLTFDVVGTRERPLCQPSVSLKLAERALPSQFVRINVVSKEAYVVNDKQDPMFDEPAYSFSPEVVPTLDEINHGRLIQEINLAIQAAVDNIADPDTPIKGKREVSIQLHFTVAEKAVRRDQIECQPVVSTKPQTRAITSQVFHLLPSEQAMASLPLYDQTKPHQEVTNA